MQCSIFFHLSWMKRYIICLHHVRGENFSHPSSFLLPLFSCLPLFPSFFLSFFFLRLGTILLLLLCFSIKNVVCLDPVTRSIYVMASVLQGIRWRKMTQSSVQFQEKEEKKVFLPLFIIFFLPFIFLSLFSFLTRKTR